MWTEWQPAELEADVQRMKALGINCCRFFLFMPAFMARPDGPEPLMLERLRFFLDCCEREQLYTFPTFIVGHMSGEDWGVSWCSGPDLITDNKVVVITQKYIQAVVQAVQDYRYLAGWVLTNELPNFVGQHSPDAVTSWVEQMVAAIRAIDPERPICVGDGGWAPEVIGEQTGFELRRLNRYQDYVGLHYYPREMSAWRHTFTTAFRLGMAKEWGRPVVVEEFGTATTLCSEENQARYYRSVFYSALINGAEGVLSWCLNDFDFEEKRPYSHHPFEERFGVVRVDKSLKPAAYEFGKFRVVVDSLIEEGYQRIRRPIGLFIPSYYYYRYPYLFQPEFKRWYDFYLEVFTLLKRANLDVRMIFEPAQDLAAGGAYTHELQLSPEKLPILILPRLKLMTKRMRRQLDQYLAGGGCIYFSFANDSWVLDWDKLAGVTTDCKFGVPDFRTGNSIQFIMKRDFGLWRSGETWEVPLIDTDAECSYCPVINTTGSVLAEDREGMPVLVEQKQGPGKVLFSAYPLEMLGLLSGEQQFEEQLVRLFRSLDLEYTLPEKIKIVGDGLEAGIWSRGESYRVLIFNHSWRPTLGEVFLADTDWKIVNSSLTLTLIGEGSYSFILPGKEVGQIDLVRECKLNQ